MKRLEPYLVFPGTCESALAFYATCFGGEVSLLERYADAPLEVAPELGHRVYNAVFEAEGIVFRASDDLPGFETAPGTNVSMFVAFDDADEQAKAFEGLAAHGKVLFPLKDGFAMLQDQYSMRWMLALEAESGPTGA